MRVLQLAAALAALSYVASLLIAQHQVPNAAAWERWTYDAFFLLLIPPILLRARHSPRLGFGWLSIALFAVLYEIGNLAGYLPVHDVGRSTCQRCHRCATWHRSSPWSQGSRG